MADIPNGIDSGATRAPEARRAENSPTREQAISAFNFSWSRFDSAPLTDKWQIDSRDTMRKALAPKKRGNIDYDKGKFSHQKKSASVYGVGIPLDEYMPIDDMLDWMYNQINSGKLTKEDFDGFTNAYDIISDFSFSIEAKETDRDRATRSARLNEIYEHIKKTKILRTKEGGTQMSDDEIQVEAERIVMKRRVFRPDKANPAPTPEPDTPAASLVPGIESEQAPGEAVVDASSIEDLAGESEEISDESMQHLRSVADAIDHPDNIVFESDGNTTGTSASSPLHTELSYPLDSSNSNEIYSRIAVSAWIYREVGPAPVIDYEAWHNEVDPNTDADTREDHIQSKLEAHKLNLQTWQRKVRDFTMHIPYGKESYGNLVSDLKNGLDPLDRYKNQQPPPYEVNKEFWISKFNKMGQSRDQALEKLQSVGLFLEPEPADQPTPAAEPPAPAEIIPPPIFATLPPKTQQRLLQLIDEGHSDEDITRILRAEGIDLAKAVRLSDTPAPEPDLVPVETALPEPAETTRSTETPVTPESVLKLEAGESQPYKKSGEDSVFANAENGAVAVFDGVGGNGFGNIASKYASEEVSKALSELPPNARREQIQEAMMTGWRNFNNARSKDLTERGYDPSSRLRPMLTTGTVVKLFTEDGKTMAAVFHAGDSRAYAVKKDGTLVQISTDDSLVQDAFEKGRITPDQAQQINDFFDEVTNYDDIPENLQRLWNDRNVIAKTFTETPNFEVIPADDFEYIFVTSDGVHDNLTKSEIATAIRGKNTPQEVADSIGQETLKHFGRNVKNPDGKWDRVGSEKENERSKEDDVSIAAIKITRESVPTPAETSTEEPIEITDFHLGMNFIDISSEDMVYVSNIHEKSYLPELADLTENEVTLTNLRTGETKTIGREKLLEQIRKGEGFKPDPIEGRKYRDTKTGKILTAQTDFKDGRPRVNLVDETGKIVGTGKRQGFDEAVANGDYEEVKPAPKPIATPPPAPPGPTPIVSLRGTGPLPITPPIIIPPPPGGVIPEAPSPAPVEAVSVDASPPLAEPTPSAPSELSEPAPAAPASASPALPSAPEDEPSDASLAVDTLDSSQPPAPESRPLNRRERLNASARGTLDRLDRAIERMRTTTVYPILPTDSALVRTLKDVGRAVEGSVIKPTSILFLNSARLATKTVSKVIDPFAPKLAKPLPEYQPTTPTSLNPKRTFIIANQSSDLSSPQELQVSEFINQEMKKGFWNWPKKIGLNWLEALAKKRVADQIRAASIKSGNPYVVIAMDQSKLRLRDLFLTRNLLWRKRDLPQLKLDTESRRNTATTASESILKQLQTEVGAGQELVQAQGELRQMLLDKIIHPLIKEEITDPLKVQELLREFVINKKNDPQVQAIFGRNTDRYGRLAEYFATNLIELTSEMKREINAGGTSLAVLDNEIDLRFARIRGRDQTERNLSITDKLIERAEGNRITGFVANPAVVSIASALALRFALKPTSRGAGASIVPIAGGILAGSIWGAIEGGYKVKVDRTTRQSGRTFMKNGEALRPPILRSNRPLERARYKAALVIYNRQASIEKGFETTDYERVPASELKTRLRNLLDTGNKSDPRVREEVIDATAEIRARLDFYDLNGIHKISYDSEDATHQQNLDLVELRAEARTVLRNEGLSDDQIITAERQAYGRYNQRFIENTEQQDRAFAAFRLKEMAIRGGIGAGIGATFASATVFAADFIENISGFNPLKEFNRAVLNTFGGVSSEIASFVPRLRDAFSHGGTVNVTDNLQAVVNADSHGVRFTSPTGETMLRGQILPDGKIAVSGNISGVRSELEQAFDIHQESAPSESLTPSETELIRDKTLGRAIKIPEGTHWVHNPDHPKTWNLVSDSDPQKVLISEARVDKKGGFHFNESASPWGEGVETNKGERIKVHGKEGLWHDASTDVNRREWYRNNTVGRSEGNELRLTTGKKGNAVILSMHGMGLGTEEGLKPNPIDVKELKTKGFFITLGGDYEKPIWIPVTADGVNDAKLRLDPDDYKHFITRDGKRIYLGDIAKMIINQEALRKLPDGNIATELYGRRDVFSIARNGRNGAIEAGRLIKRDGQNVAQIFATILGSEEAPKTINRLSEILIRPFEITKPPVQPPIVLIPRDIEAPPIPVVYAPRFPLGNMAQSSSEPRENIDETPEVSAPLPTGTSNEQEKASWQREFDQAVSESDKRKWDEEFDKAVLTPTPAPVAPRAPITTDGTTAGDVGAAFQGLGQGITEAVNRDNWERVHRRQSPGAGPGTLVDTFYEASQRLYDGGKITSKEELDALYREISDVWRAKGDWKAALDAAEQRLNSTPVPSPQAPAVEPEPEEAAIPATPPTTPPIRAPYTGPAPRASGRLTPEWRARQREIDRENALARRTGRALNNAAANVSTALASGTRKTGEVTARAGKAAARTGAQVASATARAGVGSARVTARTAQSTARLGAKTASGIALGIGQAAERIPQGAIDTVSPLSSVGYGGGVIPRVTPTTPSPTPTPIEVAVPIPDSAETPPSRTYSDEKGKNYELIELDDHGARVKYPDGVIHYVPKNLFDLYTSGEFFNPYAVLPPTETSPLKTVTPTPEPEIPVVRQSTASSESSIIGKTYEGKKGGVYEVVGIRKGRKGDVAAVEVRFPDGSVKIIAQYLFNKWTSGRFFDPYLSTPTSPGSNKPSSTIPTASNNQVLNKAADRLRTRAEALRTTNATGPKGIVNRVASTTLDASRQMASAGAALTGGRKPSTVTPPPTINPAEPVLPPSQPVPPTPLPGNFPGIIDRSIGGNGIGSRIRRALRRN